MRTCEDIAELSYGAWSPYDAHKITDYDKVAYVPVKIVPSKSNGGSGILTGS